MDSEQNFAPYSKCKRCGSANIRIVKDMWLWWLECDRCPTTYQISETKHPMIIKVFIPGESFWLKVDHENHDNIYGTVYNQLVNTHLDYEWCKYGALVNWNKEDQILSEWIKLKLS